MMLGDSVYYLDHLCPSEDDEEFILLPCYKDIKLSDIWIPKRLLTYREKHNGYKSTAVGGFHTLEQCSEATDCFSVYSNSDSEDDNVGNLNVVSSDQCNLNVEVKIDNRHGESSSQLRSTMVEIEDSPQNSLFDIEREFVTSKEKKLHKCREIFAEVDDIFPNLSAVTNITLACKKRKENYVSETIENDTGNQYKFQKPSMVTPTSGATMNIKEEKIVQKPSEDFSNLTPITYISAATKEQSKYEVMEREAQFSQNDSNTIKSQEFLENVSETLENSIPELLTCFSSSTPLANTFENIKNEDDKNNPEINRSENQDLLCLQPLAMYKVLKQSYLTDTYEAGAKQRLKKGKIAPKASKNMPLECFLQINNGDDFKVAEVDEFYENLLRNDYGASDSVKLQSVTEFPSLSPQITFVKSTENLSKSEENHNPEITLKTFSNLVWLSDDKQSSSTSDKEIMKDNLKAEELNREMVLLIIENIPATVTKEDMEIVALSYDDTGYGKLNELSPMDSGEFLRAELQLDISCNLDWIIECLDGSQPFGTASKTLKCYKKS